MKWPIKIKLMTKFGNYLDRGVFKCFLSVFLFEALLRANYFKNYRFKLAVDQRQYKVNDIA